MSKRILIVEDELPIAELEKDYLELSGFEVVICSDGTEGMKMATTEKFDMVILDLMLPGTDGFEICKKIRETSDSDYDGFSKERRHRQDPRTRTGSQ